MEGDLSRFFDAETKADFVRIAYAALETYFPMYALHLSEDELARMMYWHVLPQG